MRHSAQASRRAADLLLIRVNEPNTVDFSDLLQTRHLPSHINGARVLQLPWQRLSCFAVKIAVKMSCKRCGEIQKISRLDTEPWVLIFIYLFIFGSKSEDDTIANLYLPQSASPHEASDVSSSQGFSSKMWLIWYIDIKTPAISQCGCQRHMNYCIAFKHCNRDSVVRERRRLLSFEETQNLNLSNTTWHVMLWV